MFSDTFFSLFLIAIDVRIDWCNTSGNRFSIYTEILIFEVQSYETIDYSHNNMIADSSVNAKRFLHFIHRSLGISVSQKTHISHTKSKENSMNFYYRFRINETAVQWVRDSDSDVWIVSEKKKVWKIYYLLSCLKLWVESTSTVV